MEASKSTGPDWERSPCCLLAKVEKVRLPEGFALAAPWPFFIESCMTWGACSRIFFSSSRICLIKSARYSLSAILLRTYLLHWCTLADIRSLTTSNLCHLRRLLAHMFLLLHVRADGLVALSLGQLAGVVGAGIVCEKARARSLEAAEGRSGVLSQRQSAQGRKRVHWRHCGWSGVGVGCVVCTQGFRRGEVAFSISISRTGIPEAASAKTLQSLHVR
jgi:hypothetical protein